MQKLLSPIARTAQKYSLKTLYFSKKVAKKFFYSDFMHIF
nr:MAG TPA: hypothetical protein [Caudoviricetes sp.]